MTTIYDVLDQLRASATSERDKGDKFERLIRAFLLLDPVWADQLSDVWLWMDYPGRNGRTDTGIDLVARDRGTGHNVAIQCKFFDEGTVVSKPMIDSFLAISAKSEFGERIIVSTTDKWNKNAEEAIEGQRTPVRRIGRPELEASRVDWSRFSADHPDRLVLADKKALRPHQRDAIDKVLAGFKDHDRGKLIMACGTGKTFTSLKLAEVHTGPGGKVLFLVPSINLLSQTVREWIANAELPIRPLAVCSDPKSTKRQSDRPEDISVTDLALPATTNVAVLEQRIAEAQADESAMTVVFATYQSIDVVAAAQQGMRPFDLIVADEAHRTTGATLAGEDDSAFTRVHNDTYLPAAKRIYMTATPRIYNDATKAKAGAANALLASMDDQGLYGPEFHRLGFGEAVERGLLADYKVLVLTIDETAVAQTFQQQLSDDHGELKLDDAAKIVGCWNGLAKRGQAEHAFAPDIRPMRRAIAFAGDIRSSKRIEEIFRSVSDHYVNATDQENADGSSPLACSVEHVDGTMNALERNRKLDWLKQDPGDGCCRILTNARCLAEGVDVPALDAVMFLSPRKSVVDIVQSVGRVMRLDDTSEKQFGYIILPVGIPAGTAPEQALKDNKRYAVVWEVLQALRAHDERFDALVNRISLSKARDDKVNVIGVGGTDGDWEQTQLDLDLPGLDQWRDAIYASIVRKVGSREYWTDWAKDVAGIAERQITRITALLDDGATTPVRDAFETFLDGLRGNLNDSISEQDAIEMLAQHLITRPVFNALFDGDEFLDNNPVAQAMERMLDVLDQHDLEAENESLHRFYDSVRRKVADVKDREGRQELVRRLYDTFFATAFKKTADKLGIVYTPIQIVDFILRSADEVLQQEFGQSLSDEGVHILDGFTGTGTFLVRLLELGLVAPHDLARKYAQELHANEILLLAYYIAAVNIETTYLGVQREQNPDADYEAFPGLILTDTFQSWEDDDRPDLQVFPENNERLEHLKRLPITVIVGNPPYSRGQGSDNDNNANEDYPILDTEITSTYGALAKKPNYNTLHDSYTRAIMWASRRVQDRGVIAYVTNGGFIDNNSFDGMRKTLADECSTIYVFNLRGNQRTAGEQSRREGGKVFGGGSRATVAITILVKNPDKTGPARIRYTDVGDYLTTEQKLAKVAEAGSVYGLDARTISPNEHGDWINQRRNDFETFLDIADMFTTNSAGVKSSRDAWAYNFASEKALSNMSRLASRYMDLQRRGVDVTSGEANDPAQISWDMTLRNRFARGLPVATSRDDLRIVAYRPFTRHHMVATPSLLYSTTTMGSTFPVAAARNFAIVITGRSSHYPFAALAVDELPDAHTLDSGQFFARWRYEPIEPESTTLFERAETLLSDERHVVSGYRRIDNVTDEGLGRFRACYGGTITKDDIFFYVYGLLHSPDYRETYAADLKKMLPRIPLVEDPWPFVEAGHDLSEIHLGYESETRYPLAGLDVEPKGDPYEFFAVQKMKFASNRKTADKSTVIYNAAITLSGIPDDAHRYMLGSRSAIEWILDRYQVKTDKASGIVNDPNAWSREVGDPRYIVDLLARIVTVSLRTMQIVDELPALVIRKDQGGPLTAAVI